MHRRTLSPIVALALAMTVVALPAAAGQASQQEEKTVSGNLKTVDLEEAQIVLTRDDDTEVTLVLTPDTLVQGPGGERETLASLAGREGVEIMARYVELDERNVALAIQLVA